MADLKDIAKGTMIGFSANKTEADAKKDTETNRMVICKTKQLYLNGERLGLSDAEASYLTKKVTEEYNARMAVKVSLSKTVLEKGASNAVTVTVTTTFDSAVVVPSSISAKLNDGSALTLTKQTNNTYTGSVTKTDTFSVTATATVNGVTKSASASANAYYKFYVGQSTSATLSSLPGSGFTAKGPQSSSAGTYAFTFTAGQYAYFLLPAGVNRGKLTSAGSDGYYHASEGVSDVPFVKQESAVTINSVSYDVFRLASPQAASTHNITI